MKTIIYLSCMLIPLIGCSQNYIGVYNSHNPSHNNKRHFEQIELNSDSTFEYLYTLEFIRIEIKGKWWIEGDSLVLKENNCFDGSVFQVKEKTDDALCANCDQFYVRNLNDEYIDYQLLLINEDSIKRFSPLHSETQVENIDWQSFQIVVNSFLVSEKFYPHDDASNKFEILILDKRQLCNEKWGIDEKKVFPIGPDKKFTKYYLSKIE